MSGTPAFYINGRMLSGAQPFEAFKRIIDEELAAKTVNCRCPSYLRNSGRTWNTVNTSASTVAATHATAAIM